MVINYLLNNTHYIFILIIILIFRKNIGEILNSISEIIKCFCNISNRAKNFNYKGMNIDFNNTNILKDQQDQNKSNEFLKSNQNIFITMNEKEIKNFLDKHQITDVQAKEILINDLAYAQFYNKMLEINRIIYDEQINILYYLNYSKNKASQSDLYNA